MDPNYLFWGIPLALLALVLIAYAMRDWWAAPIVEAVESLERAVRETREPPSPR